MHREELAQVAYGDMAASVKEDQLQLERLCGQTKAAFECPSQSSFSITLFTPPVLVECYFLQMFWLRAVESRMVFVTEPFRMFSQVTV